MKPLIIKAISAVLVSVMAATALCSCTAPSLLKPEESTTKEAFDEEKFNREFYATSVPDETAESEEIQQSAENEETSASEESTTIAASGEITTVKSDGETTTLAETSMQVATKVSTSAANLFTRVTTTAKKVVDTKIDKKETKSNYKYGIVKTDVVSTYYDVYSDGTRKQTKQNSYSTYDSSKYKASTSDLLSEANMNKSTYSSQINTIISAVNASRTAAGKSALTFSDDLCTAASVRAAEMAYSTKVGSTRPDGSKCYTVLSDIGFAYKGAFEITGKNSDASSAATALVGKASGDLNSSEYTKIGVGVAPMLGNESTSTPQYYYCIIVSYDPS